VDDSQRVSEGTGDPLIYSPIEEVGLPRRRALGRALDPDRVCLVVLEDDRRHCDVGHARVSEQALVSAGGRGLVVDPGQVGRPVVLDREVLVGALHDEAGVARAHLEYVVRDAAAEGSRGRLRTPSREDAFLDQVRDDVRARKRVRACLTHSGPGPGTTPR